MFITRVILMLSAATILGGCAVTPQIQLNNGNMAMEIKAKAPIVIAVDYSRDSKSVISGGADQTTRLWDVIGVRQAMLFKGHTSAIESVAYSPDGKTIATASIGGVTNFSDNVTTLWDTATGQELKQIDGMGGKLSFSPDGRYILGNTGGFSSGTLKLWDVQTNSVVRELKYNSGRISPDGKYIVAWGVEAKGALFPDFIFSVSLFDIATGSEIWRESTECSDAVFSPDGQQLLIAFNQKENMGADLVTSYKLFDTATGKQIKEIGRTTIPSGMFSVDFVYHEIGALAFSPDGKSFLSGDLGGRYKLWDVATGTMIRPFKTVDETAGSLLNVAPSLAFSPNGRIAVVNSLAATRLYDVSTGDELATMIGFEDGEWLVTTPSGYYNSSEKGDQYLSVSVGDKPYTISQLRESFYRPDLVKLALAGGSLSEFKKIADIKPPPAVAIVDTPTSSSTDRITVSLEVKDQGGGIGDVRLYRNGTAVVLEKTRNLQVVSAAQGGQIMRYVVSLEPGNNTIRAIAFNADNSMQSTDTTIDVQAKIAVRPPALYAVVVGIKDYANPKLALTYPVADAELFASTLEDKGKGLFSPIYVHRLLKPEETTNTAITAALMQAQKDVRPEDLFVFYVASHGTVDDGQYLLITSNVGSTSSAHLKKDALSQDKLKELISNISASKKLVVLDTCDAGKLGDVLQVAMLTRGMSNDTAVKVLSRSVGSTILSASTSDQEALEGYKGHGLFTYVVVEGLNGAADADKDGFVKTLELADYVDDQVPELAERIFKHKQFPVVSPTGQGFPLTKVR
jgi:WD40 repeat protein